MSSPFLDGPVPFGFAHQGGDEVAPGNTIAAFDHAVSVGYRYIETDVQATADGVLAVYHDDELHAGTGWPGRIADFRWSELAERRVGGDHAIPRFDEVLDRYPAVRFNVDPKNDGAVDVLIDLIESRGLHDRLCLGSFSDKRLRRLRSALGPEICMSPGPIGVALTMATAVVRPDSRSSFAALQIPRSQFGIPLTTAWLVDRLHRMGLQVHVWTIDDEPTMRRLLDNGVDAIMTDKPSVLAAVLEDYR